MIGGGVLRWASPAVQGDAPALPTDQTEKNDEISHTNLFRSNRIRAGGRHCRGSARQSRGRIHRVQRLSVHQHGLLSKREDEDRSRFPADWHGFEQGLRLRQLRRDILRSSLRQPRQHVFPLLRQGRRLAGGEHGRQHRLGTPYDGHRRSQTEGDDVRPRRNNPGAGQFQK